VIAAGHLMLPRPDRTVMLADGWCEIADGRLQRVEAGPCPHTPDLGGPDALVLPGCIDTHLHLPQFDVIGVDGLTLLDWLDQAVWPAEARWADADFAARMTRRVARQLLAHGTTGVSAYATVHHEAARRALEVLGEAGLRAHLGQVLMDRQAPDELIRPTRRLLEQTESLLAHAWPGRVRPVVTPRFAITCSEPLLRGAAELAHRFNAPLQTHLAETTAECERVAALFHGMSYTQVYHHCGLLNERALFAHAVHLDDRDRNMLAAAHAAVAHCPTANRFLQSGAMDRQAMEQRGVTVALGSDVAGGPDRSMIRVARAMIDTAKQLGHTPPTPAEAWWRISAGNADALRWPQTGRLQPGAEADLLIVQPDLPWRDGPDPLGALLYGWDDRWLTHTLLRGEIAWSP